MFTNAGGVIDAEPGYGTGLSWSASKASESSGPTGQESSVGAWRMASMSSVVPPRSGVVGEQIAERTQHLGNQVPSLGIAAGPERALHVQVVR